MRTPQLKSDLVGLLHVAMQETATTTRIENAWKQLALGADDPVSLMLEADEGHARGGLLVDPRAEDEGDATSEREDAVAEDEDDVYDDMLSAEEVENPWVQSWHPKTRRTHQSRAAR